jgi:C1A family cysteine protease
MTVSGKIIVFVLIILVLFLIADSNSSTNVTSNIVRQPTPKMVHRYISKENVDKIHKFSRTIRHPLPGDTFDTMLSLGSAVAASCDLWTGAVEVVDQGPFGSCVAFSTRYAHLIKLSNSNAPLIEPSCAYWYSNARIRIGIPSSSDSGTTLAAMTWTLANKPLVPESTWKYTAYNILRQPPNINGPAAYQSNQLTTYSKPRSNAAFVPWVKSQLLSGKCVVVGIPVYSNFELYSSLASGVIPMPKGTFLGGHAVTITGFSDSRQVFNFVNSWGTYVGLSGLFTIPYNYIKMYTFEAFSL